MGQIAYKTIVITGATSGIGQALALQLAQKNTHLILAGRRTDELNLVEKKCTEKGATCVCLHIDIASTDSINRAVESIKLHHKSIDVLINNAGISQRSYAEETPVETDRKIMEVNFFGHVTITKLLWPLLTQSKHANIVLISSVVGTFGFSQRSAYSASKHALEGFFESWMIENKRTNIHFTTVSPGRIFTNISYSALKADGTSHQQLDQGQANGITAEACAKKIISGIKNNKRKIYIVQKEIILVILRKCFPWLFFRLAKNLKST
jgi:dehydrogenase/reductase SDR family member 7B